MSQQQLDAATRTLAAAFRRQRPLRGGSLIITIFGDSIAPRGGAVSLGSLIKMCKAFGITERLVRTSVGRLAQEGWFVTRRVGRQSEYQLSPRGLRRFADATKRIYSEGPDQWNGVWTLALLPSGDSVTREALRRELTWLGFGQPMPGLLIHPTRSVADTREQIASLRGAQDVVMLEARNGDMQMDKRLAIDSWDLRDLTARYRKMIVAFEPIRAAAALSPRPTPLTAFMVRTLLVHEYRKVHLREPALPRSLFPDDWVGIRAYELCRELYGHVFKAAEEYLSLEVARLRGDLPAVSHAALQRFGGLRDLSVRQQK